MYLYLSYMLQLQGSAFSAGSCGIRKRVLNLLLDQAMGPAKTGTSRHKMNALYRGKKVHLQNWVNLFFGAWGCASELCYETGSYKIREGG